MFAYSQVYGGTVAIPISSCPLSVKMVLLEMASVLHKRNGISHRLNLI